MCIVMFILLDNIDLIDSFSPIAHHYCSLVVLYLWATIKLQFYPQAETKQQYVDNVSDSMDHSECAQTQQKMTVCTIVFQH